MHNEISSSAALSSLIKKEQGKPSDDALHGSATRQSSLRMTLFGAAAVHAA